MNNSDIREQLPRISKFEQPKDLDALYIMFKGKGGGPEAESVVVDSKLDKDTVHVYSGKHDVAKLIERCRNCIVSYKVTYDTDGNPIGCDLEIKRKVFRGIYYCFKPCKDEIRDE